MMLLIGLPEVDFMKFRSGTAKHAVVQEQQWRRAMVPQLVATLVRTAAFLFCCATARFHFH